jgi:prepilin-type N-terminal cleavage/methylation domain-containing protein
MLKQHPGRRSASAGFSLIELMIGLVVGLIVVGAALALIVSINKANNQTIQATRLTQELRATAAVIASDLKRAKGVSDPFAAAKQGNNFASIIPASGAANCIRYGYAGASGGGYHAVRLDAGKVLLVTANTFAGAACDAAGQQLSSEQVNIDSMTFTVSGRKIDVTLTGSLFDPNSFGSDNISRTLTQTVFLRSIGS